MKKSKLKFTQETQTFLDASAPCAQDLKEDKRMLDLEERYMHLEKLVSELSSVIAGQDKALRRLEGEVKLLSERIRVSSSEGEDSQWMNLSHEKPPHY